MDRESKENNGMAEEKPNELCEEMGLPLQQRVERALNSRTCSESMIQPSSRSNEPENETRDNKNRPREVSSKKPVHLVTLSKNVSQNAPRDPRYDSLCGDYDEQVFQQVYKFIGNIKTRESRHLNCKMQEEADEKAKKKIKLLMQRMVNQDAEKRRKQLELEHVTQVRQIQNEMMLQGKNPQYRRKLDAKLQKLIANFEELKRKGHISKYLKKKDRNKRPDDGKNS